MSLIACTKSSESRRSGSSADLQAHMASTRTLPASSIGSREACGLKSCLQILYLSKRRNSLSMVKYTRKPLRKQFAFDLPLNSRRIHQSKSVFSPSLRLLSAFQRVFGVRGFVSSSKP